VAFAATVTEAGTVSPLELLLSATEAPPDGAACEMVTVQVAVAPADSEEGLQATDETVATTRLTVAVAEEPLRVAVTTALWLLEKVPAVAVKVALVALAATVTEAGTGSAVALLLSATEAPPDGAACEMVTVQVVAVPEGSVLGLQATDETVAETTRLTVAVAEEPLRVAVRTALWLLDKLPAVAVKVAVVALAATVTEAGTGSAVALLLSATEAPPVGAACERVTVQVVAAPEDSVLGEHWSVETFAVLPPEEVPTGVFMSVVISDAASARL